MRVSALPVLAVPLALAACDTGLGTEVARATARETVSGIVDTYLPGVPVTPVTDCIINNASGSEIISIAGDALARQPSDGTVRLVLEIAQRPGSLQCYLEQAGPLIVAQVAAAA